MKTNLKKLPKSQIEIEFELDAEEFSKYIDKALDYLKSHVKMDGFRPGQVPKELVEKKVETEDLLMEAGDLAVKASYTKFVNENNLEPISDPEVQIKKIARGSEFLFTVKVSVLPEVELPDYKAIASKVKKQDVAVTKDELEDAINYLQKSRAKFSQVDRASQKKDVVEIEYSNKDINNGKEIKDRFILGEGGFMKDFEDNVTGMKAGEEKTFTARFPENHPQKDLAGKEGEFKVKMISVQQMELPPLDDEFAKGLGAFENMAALRENIKEGITLEKREAEKQKRRNEIVSNVSQKITFDLPEKIVEQEEKRLFENFKNQVTKGANVSFEEYLKTTQKTEEEIQASFKLEAEKRIKNFLVLRQIGKAEHVEVSNEEIREEMNKVTKNYQKEQIEKIDINQLKEYAKDVIYNEKVFGALESF